MAAHTDLEELGAVLEDDGDVVPLAQAPRPQQVGHLVRPGVELRVGQRPGARRDDDGDPIRIGLGMGAEVQHGHVLVPSRFRSRFRSRSRSRFRPCPARTASHPHEHSNGPDINI